MFEDMALYTMVKTNTFNGMPLPAIVCGGRKRAGEAGEGLRLRGLQKPPFLNQLYTGPRRGYNRNQQSEVLQAYAAAQKANVRGQHSSRPAPTVSSARKRRPPDDPVCAKKGVVSPYYALQKIQLRSPGAKCPAASPSYRNFFGGGFQSGFKSKKRTPHPGP